MTTGDIESRFFAILSSMLQVPAERLDHESSRKTISAWDSLKHMHLVRALEEEFEIEFDDPEIANHYWRGALVEEVGPTFVNRRWREPPVIEALFQGTPEAVTGSPESGRLPGSS